MKVRLYLRSSGVWWVAYTKDRRTVRRSTRAVSEDEARRVVESWGDLPASKVFKFEEVGLVYFLSAEGTGRVKIGWTRSAGLEKRVADLQIGCPVPLRVITTYPGTLFNEHMEHARLRSSWVHGEWFDETEEVLGRIREVSGRELPADCARRTETTRRKRERT